MTDTEKKRAVVLIPAYKPDKRLIELTRELIVDNGLDVLLVDDGGQEAYAPIFDACRELGAEVAVHAVNMGKGRALKTGINAAMLKWPDMAGIVTADADGQHTPADILRLIDALHEHPDKLVLGSRTFTGEVPAKSRWGNRITRLVYALASGIHVSDTQTGLRALPASSLPAMARIDGERYEYEMNVLLKLRDLGLGVFEVPIETIYIDDNAGSHFNPVRDAIKIYMVIFKYLFSSILSFVIDYALYWLCLGVFGFSALISYALARLVSSQVNYHLNKHTVFGGRGGKGAMLRYYALCVTQGVLGAALVQVLPGILPLSAAVIKIPVDLLLFMLSYFIQRDYVFKK
ncbi:MAG: bifunctional glycosyltransferase family 2/GtrA family protein [Christensenellales bacterium]|nr:bifunctional glycosyltransferase family 2/GtrA family protein [Christensenellales bacterium]